MTSDITFYEWLGQFEKQQTAIGDLARDVRRDPDFPILHQTKDMIKDYLESRNASQKVLDVFVIAWKKYQKSQ